MSLPARTNNPRAPRGHDEVRAIDFANDTVLQFDSRSRPDPCRSSTAPTLVPRPAGETSRVARSNPRWRAANQPKDWSVPRSDKAQQNQADHLLVLYRIEFS